MQYVKSSEPTEEKANADIEYDSLCIEVIQRNAETWCSAFDF